MPRNKVFPINAHSRNNSKFVFPVIVQLHNANVSHFEMESCEYDGFLTIIGLVHHQSI